MAPPKAAFSPAGNPQGMLAAGYTVLNIIIAKIRLECYRKQ